MTVGVPDIGVIYKLLKGITNCSDEHGWSKVFSALFELWAEICHFYHLPTKTELFLLNYCYSLVSSLVLSIMECALSKYCMDLSKLSTIMSKNPYANGSNMV